jgi:hypothetical protein
MFRYLKASKNYNVDISADISTRITVHISQLSMYVHTYTLSVLKNGASVIAMVFRTRVFRLILHD